MFERHERHGRSRLDLVLGENLRFNQGAIERCCNSELDELDVDLLVTTAAVACADRRVRRPGRGRWSRSLRIHVPVHEAAAFSAHAPKLSNLLTSLTGDRWEFEFRSRDRADSALLQGFIPGLGHEFGGGTVLPYSGGLDSFAALSAHLAESATAPVLLVHARHGGRALADVLPSAGRGAPSLAVPFHVSAGRRPEPSYRSRTFVFFSLAALICRRTQARRIVVGEPGQGCLGPALVPFGVEHPVRGCHPVFVAELANFYAGLLRWRPRFEFPHLWMTKGQVLARLTANDAIGGWAMTHSCSRPPARQHPSHAESADHCGICGGCLFRRQSLLVAGLSAGEPKERYLFDVFRQAQLPKFAGPADREVGVYAVRALEELATCSNGELDLPAHSREIARALERPEAEVRASLETLLRAHADEWQRFLGKMPKKSWVVATANAGREDNHGVPG